VLSHSTLIRKVITISSWNDLAPKLLCSHKAFLWRWVHISLEMVSFPKFLCPCSSSLLKKVSPHLYWAHTSSEPTPLLKRSHSQSFSNGARIWKRVAKFPLQHAEVLGVLRQRCPNYQNPTSAARAMHSVVSVQCTAIHLAIYPVYTAIHPVLCQYGTQQCTQQYTKFTQQYTKKCCVSTVHSNTPVLSVRYTAIHPAIHPAIYPVYTAIHPVYIAIHQKVLSVQ